MNVQGNTSGPSRLTATLIGSIAIILWGTLALLTTWTGKIPPFQLVASTFAIAFLVALTKWILRRENPLRHLRHPPIVWIFGIAGLFGYHLFYFIALKNAPPVDASLIAYLWPLLIVVFSALLPGEDLRWYHAAGALMGLGGCALLVTRGGALSFDLDHSWGYAAAGLCALIWSSYSVISRRFASVSTDTVGWFCGGVAFLAGIAHLGTETTLIPTDAGTWLAVIGLGLGPVGIAFFAWDIGMKRGEIKLLGVLSYGAPLISVLLLIAFGGVPATLTIGLACLAITGGAVVASLGLFTGKGT